MKSSGDNKERLYQKENNVLFLLTDPKLSIEDNTSLNYSTS